MATHMNNGTFYHLSQDSEQIYKHLVSQGMSNQEAVDELISMRKAVSDGDANPFELMEDMSLEEDFVFGLL